MAKEKNKSKKPGVKVNDLPSKDNPKGGKGKVNPNDLSTYKVVDK